MAKLSQMVKTEGLSPCAFLRVCGSLKLDNATSKRMAFKAGFEPADGTVGIQAKRGRDGDGVPKVSSSLKARIKKLASQAPSGDEAGSETPKAGKSTGKKKGKKSKKAVTV